MCNIAEGLNLHGNFCEKLKQHKAYFAAWMAISQFMKNAENLKNNTLNAPAAGIFQEICVLFKVHECLFRKNFATKKARTIFITWHYRALTKPFFQFKRNNKFCVYCWGTCHNSSIVCCTTIFYGELTVRFGMYKIYLNLYIKCTIFLSVFNQVWSSSTNFASKNPIYNFMDLLPVTDEFVHETNGRTYRG